MFQEFLTISALIFFNLLCSFGVVIMVYVFLLLRKLNQSIEEVKYNIQSKINTIDDLIGNFSWLTTIIPFALNFLPKSNKKKTGWFSRK